MARRLPLVQVNGKTYYRSRSVKDTEIRKLRNMAKRYDKLGKDATANIFRKNVKSLSRVPILQQKQVVRKMPSARRGMMKGRGKGYRNVIHRDVRVHSMSAKGIKQPQKIRLIRVEKKGRQVKTRRPKEVIRLADSIENRLSRYCSKIMIVGSIRRKKDPTDIDIVCIPKNERDKEKIVDFIKTGKVREIGDKIVSSTIKGVQVDIYFATKDTWGSQILTYTGSSGYSIGLRVLAKKQGKLLNQYGLFDRDTHKLLASKTEADIYKALGKSRVKPPEERG